MFVSNSVRGQNLKRAAVGLTVVFLLAGCASAPPRTIDEIPKITLGTQSSQAPELSEVPDSDQDYARDPKAEIEIEDQQGDGHLIEMHEIHVGRSSAFLVIYDQAGTVLVTTLLSQLSQPVSIALDSPILNSQKLRAELYLDDGDGIFKLTQDLPLIGENGKVVAGEFEYRVVK